MAHAPADGGYYKHSAELANEAWRKRDGEARDFADQIEELINEVAQIQADLKTALEFINHSIKYANQPFNSSALTKTQAWALLEKYVALNLQEAPDA